MMIAAVSLGLGSVWLGIYPKQDIVSQISKLLKLPPEIIPLAVVLTGYPPNPNMRAPSIKKNEYTGKPIRQKTMKLSKQFVDALAYAANLHADQVRKGDGNIPYISHLLGVTSIVLEYGGNEEQAIAALLHDAVEDQGACPS